MKFKGQFRPWEKNNVLVESHEKWEPNDEQEVSRKSAARSKSTFEAMITPIAIRKSNKIS